MHIIIALNSHKFTRFLLGIEYCARLLGMVWDDQKSRYYYFPYFTVRELRL